MDGSVISQNRPQRAASSSTSTRLMIAAFAIAVFVSVGACTSDRAKPIADSTMVDVLIELHLLNARLRITNRPIDGARDSIFVRYGLDSTTFSRAVEYYANHTDEYSQVYGRVVDALSAEGAPISAQDSILSQPGPMPPSR